MTVAWQPIEDQTQRRQRARSAEPASRRRRDRKGAFAKHLSARSRCGSCTRVTQSIVFFSSGGIEALYSGVTTATP